MPDLPGGPTDPTAQQRIDAAVAVLDAAMRDPSPTERELAEAIRRARAVLKE